LCAFGEKALMNIHNIHFYFSQGSISKLIFLMQLVEIIWQKIYWILSLNFKFRLKPSAVFYFLFLIYLVNYNAEAQDTINLNLVNIVDSKKEKFANDINIDKLDSFSLANISSKDLSQILSEYSNIRIKSYGYSSMANASMRGGNSYQTAVLWDGFNLQDPLNGGVNLMLMPGFFIDKIEIYRGGEAALFGGGAMSGSVNITSKPKFNDKKSMEIFGGIGSFSKYSEGIKLKFSNSKFATSIKYFHTSAANDFEFINYTKSNSPTEVQKNAMLLQRGLLIQNAFFISKYQLITTNLWYQYSKNNLPFSMMQTSLAESFTTDENFKASINYSFVASKFTLRARTAAFLNSLNYIDKNTGFDFSHKSISNILEIETEFKLSKRNIFLAGVNSNYIKGISENLSPNAKAERISFFASFLQKFGSKLETKINIRQEFAENYNIPLTYSFKGSYILFPSLEFFVSYAKNYRIPTFNDLFWKDFASSGNLDLKPELANTYDVGAAYTLSTSRTKLLWSLNYYNSLKNNLIQWVPVSSVWIPQNYEQVHSYGIESNLEFQVKFKKKSMLYINLKYEFSESKITKSNYIYAEDVLGKQMIFSPMNSANIIGRYIYKNSFLEIQNEVVGKIFTTDDNSTFLNPYSLTNIAVGNTFLALNKSLVLTFKINNLWKTKYFVMPNYAMPGINFELNLLLKINENHEKK